jgi:CheY-like chemotaxis protein
VGEAGPEATGLRVLVVSDDARVREEARFGFPPEATVTFAIDTRQASPALEGQRPSIVVVDMQTGNAGGYAMARNIAETSRLARVPVLILLERDHDAWLAKAAGATAYRTKPLHPGQLARDATALAASSPGPG